MIATADDTSPLSRRKLPFTVEQLLDLSKEAGEPEWLAAKRKSHLMRFAETSPRFGRYSRLLLDWQSLPVKAPVFEEPHFNVDGVIPVRPSAGNAAVRLLSEAVGEGEDFLSERVSARSEWDDLVLAGWREGLSMSWKGERGAGRDVACLTIGDPGGLVLEPLLLDVEADGRADLFIHWRGGDDPSMHMSLLGGRIGDRASLKVFLLHEGRGMHHYVASSFKVGRDASVEVYSAWMGGKWTVARLSAEMHSPGATWKESHMVMCSGREHLDLDSRTAQLADHTHSDVQVRTVVEDAARAVFTGNILMEKEAALSEAYLADHVLLLSPKAHADSIPGLEIKALDVKASHAASVGQVDDEQMFYLQSRGLDPVSSKRLIVVGFQESLFNRAPFPFIPEIVDPILEDKVNA